MNHILSEEICSFRNRLGVTRLTDGIMPLKMAIPRMPALDCASVLGMISCTPLASYTYLALSEAPAVSVVPR